MILDIIFIAVLLICLWFGLKRGFVRTFVGFAGLILSVLATYLLYRPYMNFIHTNEWIAPRLSAFKDTIIQHLSPTVATHMENIVSGEESALPAFISKNLINAQTQAQGVDAVTNAIAEITVNVLAVLAFLLLIKLVLWVVTRLLFVACRVPGIKQVNSLMGAGFGLINGVILCYLLAAVLFLFSVDSQYSWIHNQLETAKVASYFYTNNLILNLIVGLNIIKG